jgi:hypothetical protein
MSKRPLHPAVVQLLGVGAKALNAGLEAFADTLLETAENGAEEVAARVRRGRAVIKGETVEGEPKPRKRRSK